MNEKDQLDVYMEDIRENFVRFYNISDSITPTIFLTTNTTCYALKNGKYNIGINKWYIVESHGLKYQGSGMIIDVKDNHHFIKMTDGQFNSIITIIEDYTDQSVGEITDGMVDYIV